MACQLTARANVKQTVRTLFQAAVRDGVGGLQESPVRLTVTKPQARDLGDANVATPEQVKELADAMPSYLSLAVYLAAWCALRQGEVLGLQRGDFEDQNGVLVVHVRRQWAQKARPPAYTPTKTKAARSLVVPNALRPLVEEHLGAYVSEGEDAPLFPSMMNEGVPVSQTYFNKAWLAAREEVGMPGFRFHDLRHTGLTEFARQGATLAELMHRGGHADVQVALRYQHATIERDYLLAEKLPVRV